MARLKDRLMDARLARSLAILIIVTLALYALTAVAFHHLFATQIGEVRNLAYSLEGQYIGSWQTFRPTPIQPGVNVAAAAMLRRDRTQGQLLHGLWTRIHTQVPIMRSGLS